MRYRGGAWTNERIARLGFLIGLGWYGDEIANDLSTSKINVYVQANRLGLSFRGAAFARKTDPINRAAQRRRITPDQLVERLLALICADQVLIDNILDDDVERAA
jgi:hypothetical protein